MKGSWWICATRTLLLLREMPSLAEAISEVGDPRAETLCWVCKAHAVIDCPSCLEGVSAEEHPFK